MAEEKNWEDPIEETRAERVGRLISAVSAEISKAHKEKYDIDTALLTAALSLDAQKELVEFLADAEFLAKEAANKVDSLEAEKYYSYKTNSTDKTTDQGLKFKVAADEDVIKAKENQSKAEADYNKWRNLFGILKDSHVFFRSLGRGKSDW
jgi:hypothetical protein